MANTYIGYDNFRFMTLSKVEILYWKSVDPWHTTYTIDEGVLAEGSGANIEEIKVNEHNVGIKSTINIVMAYSDYTDIALLSQFDEERIQQVRYYLKNTSGINVDDITITVNHSGNTHITQNTKIVEGEYSMAEIEIIVIDDVRHITDIMTTS